MPDNQRSERIRKLELELIPQFQRIVEEQGMRQSRPAPTTVEFDRLEELKRELARLKAQA